MSTTIHPTYRYLDRKIRLAALTLSQWAQLLLAGVAAWALAQLLPLPSTYALSVAVTVAGVPVAASIAGATGAIDPWQYARALLSWRRQAALYLPAAAAEARPHGYQLTVAQVVTPETDLTIEELWA